MKETASKNWVTKTIAILAIVAVVFLVLSIIFKLVAILFKPAVVLSEYYLPPHIFLNLFPFPLILQLPFLFSFFY